MMEGKKPIKQEPMTPQFDLDPDDPIPSIERSESGSPELQVTTALPRRERIHPRGGLIGSQRRQTLNIQQIPRPLRREPRGSLASYADNLREFLGPLDPLGHEQRREAIRISRQQEQADVHDRTSDARYYESLREFLGPLNPRGQQPQPQPQQAVTRVNSRVSSQSHLADPRTQTAGLSDLHPSSQASNSRPMSNHIRALGSDRFQSVIHPSSMQYSSPYQLPVQVTPFRRFSGTPRDLVLPIDSQPQLRSNAMPIHRSHSAKVSGQNVDHSNSVAYEPLPMALDHDTTLQTSVPAPQNLQQSINSLSVFPTSDNSSYVQQNSKHQSNIPAPDEFAMGGDELIALQSSIPTATGSSSTTQGSSSTSIPVCIILNSPYKHVLMRYRSLKRKQVVAVHCFRKQKTTILEECKPQIHDQLFLTLQRENLLNHLL